LRCLGSHTLEYNTLLAVVSTTSGSAAGRRASRRGRRRGCGRSSLRRGRDRGPAAILYWKRRYGEQYRARPRPCANVVHTTAARGLPQVSGESDPFELLATEKYSMPYHSVQTGSWSVSLPGEVWGRTPVWLPVCQASANGTRECEGSACLVTQHRTGRRTCAGLPRADVARWRRAAVFCASPGGRERRGAQPQPEAAAVDAEAGGARLRRRAAARAARWHQGPPLRRCRAGDVPGRGHRQAVRDQRAARGALLADAGPGLVAFTVFLANDHGTQ
jgi:hypothetical protein